LVSIPTVLEKLTAIEQSIGQRDLRDVEHELLELLEASEGADPHISDRILNIQLQILIGENRFEELSQAVDVERDVAHADAAVRMLIGKGILANRNGDYRNSLIHFLEAESKALINGNKSLIAQVQVNIGTVYAALHHYKDGLDRYDHVLKKYKKEISNSTQAALLHNLGNLYYTIGDIEESIACFQASINLNNTSTIERSKILLNRSYIAQGKGAVAETAAISKEHDLYPVYLFCSSFGNSAIAQLGRLKEAAKTAQSRNDYTTALAALKHIINIYKTEGAYKEVCEYLEKYAMKF